MKFRSERDSLVEVLATAGRAVGGRGAQYAALSGLLLVSEGNQLMATGTDLDLTIRVELEVIGIDDGSCVVPARLTADIVRPLEPGAVTVEGSEEKIEISAARSHFGLRAFPVVEFPTVSNRRRSRSIARRDPGGRSPPGGQGGVDRRCAAAAHGCADDEPSPAPSAWWRPTPTGSPCVICRGRRVSANEDILVPARALAELQRLPASSNAAGTAPMTVAMAAGPNEITFIQGRSASAPACSTAPIPTTGS